MSCLGIRESHLIPKGSLTLALGGFPIHRDFLRMARMPWPFPLSTSSASPPKAGSFIHYLRDAVEEEERGERREGEKSIE